jgi:hypothetical protein
MFALPFPSERLRKCPILGLLSFQGWASFLSGFKQKTTCEADRRTRCLVLLAHIISYESYPMSQPRICALKVSHHALLINEGISASEAVPTFFAQRACLKRQAGHHSEITVLCC